jgi:poly(glycerol-phosphate) alpha-glucosyltransferase
MMADATRQLEGRRIGLLTSLLSRHGGGVFSAVVRQAEVVRSLGATPVVVGLADGHSAADSAAFGDAEVLAFRTRGPAVIGYAPGMGRALAEARLDLLHLHGIWNYPSAAGLGWARRTGRPYVISPHGMLEPSVLARSPLKKAIARALYERAAWARADRFHALTQAEARDIRAAAFSVDPVVIPNAAPTATSLDPAPRAPQVLSLGRIHAVKNGSALVEGWRLADAAGRLPSGARLTIAGWGAPADVTALQAAIDAGPPSIRFVGPLFDAAKFAAMREARFLAVPSLSEGLPMAALEAWSVGTPALLSEGCNLPEAFAAGAAIDCGTAPATIADALATALALSEERWQAMAGAARALAAGPFSLETVTRAWGEAYGAALAGLPQVSR